MPMMTRQMTRQELEEWRERWRIVNERQREELRRMTHAEKFEVLGRLMSAGSLFDMSRRKAADDAARELWMKLRSRMLGRE
jgi:hypothetical protein